MRLILDGNINIYYVQTLCMIFFPGAKFGATEQEDPNAPELRLTLTEQENGMEATATLTVDGKSETATKFWEFSEYHTVEKTAKLVCGAAVIAEFRTQQ